MDHAEEERIIHLFAKKEKRERLLFLASKPRRRSELVDALLHDTRSLDRSRMRVLGAQCTVAEVIAALGGKATSLAYAIAAIDEIDGRELPLAEALACVVGRQQDALVLCRDRATAYYENHEGERFLLV